MAEHMAVKHDLGVVPVSIGHPQLALFFVTHAEHDALGCEKRGALSEDALATEQAGQKAPVCDTRHITDKRAELLSYCSIIGLGR